jgi:hypothetical protein
MSATGDLLDSKDAKIAELMRQLAEAQAQARIWEDRCHEEEKNATQHYTDLLLAQAEIECMRPVVGAAVGLYKSNSGISSMKFFQAVRDYEAKEKP